MLSWNEIRDRAIAFSREWAGESSEDAEAQTFVNEFFEVFGITRRRTATFEVKVKKLDGHDGFIDLLWKGKLLIEMKSRGKDMARAHKQAQDYFPGLQEHELPRCILVCDFEHFHLYDLDGGQETQFTLAALHKHVRQFAFLLGYESHSYKEQDPVNVKAAEVMGRLHDQLRDVGYTDHDLEVLLVRLLFCLFADDTGIFQPDTFLSYIEYRTAPDGSDLGSKLNELFEVLNQPEDSRLKSLDEDLAAFPYVNGRLFADRLRTPAFTSAMRRQLLECGEVNWSRISPAIFGALFQSIMDADARRHLGAHYTSERNILKLIRPLFLDDLHSEFKGVRSNPKKLRDFHAKLRSLKFLDPACGCGNFLAITYRELRLLEFEVLLALRRTNQLETDLRAVIKLDVDQFYGIEIEEFPAQIAQVALWLVDHQMNVLVSEALGQWLPRIPLRTSPTIVHGDALETEWASIVSPRELGYILGNPPFGGARLIDAKQSEQIKRVFGGITGAGVLDYVTAWYMKAARFIQGTPIKCAFVSTNSVSQGEQPGVLWTELFKLGVKIHFAHRTFVWRNEARGVAAVHCVIIGFACADTTKKTIFDYSDPTGDPVAIPASNINPYLVDAPDIVLKNRSHPICEVPEMGIGNKPIDGGNYLFTGEEKAAFVAMEPRAEKWFRRWIGSDEFINGWERWCLWLGDCPPDELRRMPEAMRRVEAVRKLRSESKSAPTRKLATMPTRFHVENMPAERYLVMPKVSSERRAFIPSGFESGATLSSDLLFVLPSTSRYHFGVLSSTMHMAWVRAVCGRLKSDYRYSAGIVYNNFPWPVDASEKQRTAVETAAQGVLDARAQFPNASLADLYDPNSMPPALARAHARLDAAVDATYGKKTFGSEAERVAYLFERYQALTAPLIEESKARRRRIVR